MITQQQLLVSQKNFPHIAFTETDLQGTLTELRENLAKHGAHVRKRAAHAPVNEKNLLEPHIDGLQRLDTFLGKLGLLIEASSKNKLDFILILGKEAEETKIGFIAGKKEILSLDELLEQAEKHGKGKPVGGVIASINAMKTFLFLLNNGEIGKARDAFDAYCEYTESLLSMKIVNAHLEELGAKQRLDENILLNSFKIYKNFVLGFLKAYDKEANPPLISVKNSLLLLAFSSLLGFPMVLKTEDSFEVWLKRIMLASGITALVCGMFGLWIMCIFEFWCYFGKGLPPDWQATIALTFGGPTFLGFIISLPTFIASLVIYFARSRSKKKRPETLPDELQVPEALHGSASETRQPEEDFIFCMHCGAKLPGVAKFCMECGKNPKR